MTLGLSAVDHCPQCGTQLAPGMLACPGCARLVHGARLTELARLAKVATARGDISGALAAWREALDLLPVGSKQHTVISQTITDLGRRLAAGEGNAPDSKARDSNAGDSNAGDSNAPADGQAGKPKSLGSRAAGAAGAVGLMLWKLKTLLLGLTKISTLLSMLVSLGVYWTIWGWKFALGMVLSIYVHEMGHVIKLRQYGFKATAPMFIPGLGAMIRLQQQVTNPVEDAEIGLAGPTYGLYAALATLGIWRLTNLPIFAAIAGVAAWINLFNLVPISPLDGGRGFHAMSRPQRFMAAAAFAGAWYFTHDGLLIVLALVAAVRAAGDKNTIAGDWKITTKYLVLIAALSAVAMARMLVDTGN